MRLRDYAGRWEFDEFIKTPAHPWRVFGGGRGTKFGFRLAHGLEGSVACDGLSAQVDPAVNKIRVSVPTSCLK